MAEHQRTRLKIAGSSPTEVHFSPTLENVAFQTNLARLGVVALD